MIDEEPDVAAIIKMGLEKDGFEVDAFNDPVAARANFKPGLYDLLLPDINGFELYRELVNIDERQKFASLRHLKSTMMNLDGYSQSSK